MHAGVPAGVRRFVVRTLLACLCLAAARYVPFLAYFMSLIGSFLTIGVSVILPVSLHLKIFQACFLCHVFPEQSDIRTLRP